MSSPPLGEVQRHREIVVRKLCLGAMVSTFLVCMAPEARADEPIEHPYYLEMTQMEQAQGELMVVYALKSLDFKSDYWDDYIAILNIDTFDNSPEYETPDVNLFSEAESANVASLPQKVYNDDLPIYITVSIFPEKEGYGRTTLDVQFRFNESDYTVSSAVFFRSERGQFELLDEEAWFDKTARKATVSYFKDGKRYSQVTKLGSATKDAGAADPKTGGVAVPEDVPKSYSEIARNNDDYLKPEPGEEGKGEGAKSILNIYFCMKISYIAYYSSIPSGDYLDGITVWRPIDNESYQRAQGFRVELWDKDTETSDDYIGTYFLNYSGPSSEYACASFPWDQSATGEDYPDPYPISRLSARSTGTSNCDVKVCAGDSCGEYSYSWRSDAYTDCGGTCNSISWVFSYSRDSEANKQAMILRSAQRFAEEWGGMSGIFTNSTIYYRYGSYSNSVSISRDDVETASSLYQKWAMPAHEAGHCLQKQAFEQDSLTGTDCPSPHSFTDPNNEACATREGWAAYVAVRSYWFETDTSAKPIYSSEPIEEAEPYDNGGCSRDYSDNDVLEIQVAKTFWDFVDVNNEDYVSPAGQDDILDSTRQKLCNAWDSFPNGTDNHQDKETGDSMNLEDFTDHFNEYEGDIYIDATKAHNCVFQDEG